MKNLFRSSCLVVALIASAALVGCGGGGGGGTPVSPSTKVSNEARAAQAVITPIVTNASQILGEVTASSRTSVSGNVSRLSNNAIGNSVVKALKTPKLLRAVITAVGGNIEGGLWNKEGMGICEIATYSNNVYERSIYAIDEEIIAMSSAKDLEDINEYRIGHYVIEGCNADLRNGILYGITIKPNAKISVENQSYGKPLYYSFKGTIDTDLTIKWVEPKYEEFKDSSLVVNFVGEDVTDSKLENYAGVKVSEKTTCNTIYTFSRMNLKLTDICYDDYSKLIEDYSNNNENFKNKKYKGNINVNISGVKGSVNTKNVSYVGKFASFYQGEWRTDGFYNSDYDLVVYSHPTDYDLTLTAPVKITVNGDAFDTYGDYIDESGKEIKEEKINTANIKNVSVVINSLTKPASGRLEEYAINDAEAHVEVEANIVDEVIMIGDQEVAFNKAKIDITGLKYDYKWEPTALEVEWLLNSSGNLIPVENEEYNKQVIEMNRKCFGSAKVLFEAEETKNSVTIKAECDLKAKTAKANIVNNGNYIVKDKINSNGSLEYMEFNFKTIDIKATNVDLPADNKCEGALLEVTGVEKDGTKSVRNYKVVNGKMVLQKANDKQPSEKLPKVEIAELPEGLSDDSNSIENAVAEANADLEKPEATKTTKNNEGTLKVVEKNGKKIGSFHKEHKDSAGKTKEINSNITAKDKIICVVSYYGNEFTFVFVIDYTNAKSPKIKGSIFNGKVENKTIDSPDRFAQFAGEGGKITVITSEGSSTVSVQ